MTKEAQQKLNMELNQVKLILERLLKQIKRIQNEVRNNK